VNTHRKIDIGGERESESERERERGGGDTLVERLARGRVIIIRAWRKRGEWCGKTR